MWVSQTGRTAFGWWRLGWPATCCRGTRSVPETTATSPRHSPIPRPDEDIAAAPGPVHHDRGADPRAVASREQDDDKQQYHAAIARLDEDLHWVTCARAVLTSLTALGIASDLRLRSRQFSMLQADLTMMCPGSVARAASGRRRLGLGTGNSHRRGLWPQPGSRTPRTAMTKHLLTCPAPSNSFVADGLTHPCHMRFTCGNTPTRVHSPGAVKWCQARAGCGGSQGFPAMALLMASSAVIPWAAAVSR